MEFMFLFTERKDEAVDAPDGFKAMNKFAEALASQRKLRRGAPLKAESEGVRVRMHEGRPFVSDGPFAESKEFVGGFWIVEAASRDEALEIAARTPHASYGIVEVHEVQWRNSVADPEKGKPFLMVFGVDPSLSDPDGAKMREMVAFSEGLKREGKFIETAPLRREPPPARVEVRRGETLVTDGPFAEAKEAVGGYALVRVADRAEAIELAKRYPHAKWGPVEVREIIFFDET